MDGLGVEACVGKCEGGKVGGREGEFVGGIVQGHIVVTLMIMS